MIEIIIAVIGLVGTVLIALIGLWAGRKLGLNEHQNRLVDILKDTTDAQDKKIKELQNQLKSTQSRLQVLEKHAKELESLVISQELEIRRLTDLANGSVSQRRSIKE